MYIGIIGIIGIILGFMSGLYWGYIRVYIGIIGIILGFMLGLCWGYMGIMEKKMETTILGYIGFRVVIGHWVY